MGKSSRTNLLIVTEPLAHGIYRYVSDVERGGRLGRHWNTFLVYSSIRSDRHLTDYLAELQEANIGHLDLKISNNPCLSDFFATLKLFYVCCRFQPDVIQASCAKAGFLVRVLSFFGALKTTSVLYVPHAYYRTEDLVVGKISFLHWVERILSPYAFTMNVSWSERSLGINALWVNSRDSAVFPNWVDMDRFRPKNNKKNIIMLGTVARFTKQKNPLALHRALIRLCKEVTDVHFMHVGDGLLKNKCVQLWDAAGLSDRLHIVDPHSAVEKNLAEMDGFVLPSLFEGMPFVILEAGAVNLPMLLSNVSGNSDFNKFNLNSLLWCTVEEADILRGLHSLVKLIRSGDAAECNHRDVIGINFSAEHALARLFDAMEGMIRINRGSVV